VRIDWFTFVAQLFNFVLLVFLLKRFLYRPVLDTIARREVGIRERLEEARRREEEADAGGRELRALREEWEQGRAGLLREAEAAAAERRRKLTREAEEEVRAVRREWQESLLRQRETFLQELRRRMTGRMYGVVHRVLADLADAALEERVIRTFLRRMEAADEELKVGFLKAMQAAGGRGRVTTAFPLAPELRRELEGAVKGWGGTPVELDFEENPGLALGIELRAGDRKIAWSVESYLEELEAGTLEQLEAEGR
jgi:F-type H+-transporting ATPase subunit b